MEKWETRKILVRKVRKLVFRLSMIGDKRTKVRVYSKQKHAQKLCIISYGTEWTDLQVKWKVECNTHLTIQIRDTRVVERSIVSVVRRIELLLSVTMSSMSNSVIDWRLTTCRSKHVQNLLSRWISAIYNIFLVKLSQLSVPHKLSATSINSFLETDHPMATIEIIQTIFSLASADLNK